MSAEDKSSGKRTLLNELRRRRVVSSCVLYIIVCWAVIQGSEILASPLGFEEDVVIRVLILAAILGFPIVVVLSWFYQITAKGIERTEPFVERRILNNIAPINDRRRDQSVGMVFAKDKYDKAYDWILSVETGPLSGLSFGITQDTVLGRSLDSDIAIVTPHISRHHARLSLQDGQLFIEDLGSSNGTSVNGNVINARQTLRHDDEFHLHDITFRISERLTRPDSEQQAMNKTTFVSHKDSIP